MLWAKRAIKFWRVYDDFLRHRTTNWLKYNKYYKPFNYWKKKFSCGWKDIDSVDLHLARWERNSCSSLIELGKWCYFLFLLFLYYSLARIFLSISVSWIDWIDDSQSSSSSSSSSLKTGRSGVLFLVRVRSTSEWVVTSLLCFSICPSVCLFACSTHIHFL